ncbi:MULTISPECIES: DUF2782 domain-containing protein [Chromohalobacter]|uniref:DUF2782 domain-containing protein n=1 Tax=Chromohalobacter TaxID=42054 RepID=UPI001CC717C6|nr:MULTISPECIES: DUF2782 domain-containing protein [Chromohalobacter]MBZ5876047.1 DUF2782 domain-containing protein [Chromohalobacter salexigens]NQY46940.1 DUF2782 domain-containing protein [Chromohalobacter sp.]
MQRSRILPPLILGLCLGVIAPPVVAQQPEITVRQDDARTIKEYRVNGKLYAIEIMPRGGSAYYLVDDDGDGNFARSDSADLEVPDWVTGD